MIICPNKKNPEVAREFNELVQATSKQAAYHIWSLNNGNAIDRAPNGAPSKLFLTLLEHYNGDRTKAIQAKAKTYGTSFLAWFGDWTGNYEESLNSDEIAKTVLSNGKIRLSLPTHTEEHPRQIVLEPQGDNKYYIHMRIWDGEKVPGEISDSDKRKLFNALYKELPVGAEILFPKSGEGYYGTRGTVAGLMRLARDKRFDKGEEGVLLYEDKDGSIKEYRGTSFIKVDMLSTSKVIDENGEPLVVWHGGHLTDNNSFPNPTYVEDAFDMFNGMSFPGREKNPGIWFTTDPKYARVFYSDTYLVYLNIKHPYYGDNLHSNVAALIKEQEDYIIPEDVLEESGGRTDGLIGHDAATFDTIKSDGIEFAIYDPNLAKSVDNEGPTPYEGTFSRENDDIYYQENSREVARLNEVYLYEYNTELKLLETTDFNPFDYFKNRDYAVLSEKTSIQFDNYRSKVIKYKKDDKFGFPKQFFDEVTGILYIKSNNYKNSRRYDAVDSRTGEVFKYGITLFTHDEFKKLNYKISKLDRFVPKTFNAKRAINFALLSLMPSKNRYKTIAKQFIYDSIDPKETTINFEIIDRFVDSMPDALWDYISSSVYGFNEDMYIGPFYVGTTDTSNINAATFKINTDLMAVNLPKLGLITFTEKITGIKLLGRSVKFNSANRKLPNKNRKWNEEVILDNNLTRPEIEYLIHQILEREYFKKSTEKENIEHYAKHNGKTVDEVRKQMDFENEEFDDMRSHDMSHFIRHYDWLWIEFMENIEEQWGNIVKSYIIDRYQDKFTTNDVNYIVQYFSGLLPWIKIDFNTDSYSGENEPFLRLFSVIHEPFHALHALTYGSAEEIALRNSYKELMKTPFGKKLHDLVKNSLTRNVDEEGLYKEICAYMFQIINTPKELILLGGDEFLSSKIYKLIKNIIELPIETIDKKVTSTQYVEQEKEEHIKLTFLQKLYNVIVSALHKIIPLTKQYINLINNVINVKEYVEVVTENTVTEETERSKLLQQLKKDFLTKLDEFEGAIKALQSVDNNVLSSLYIDNFFKNSKSNYQESQLPNEYGDYDDNKQLLLVLKNLGQELMKKCKG